MLTRRRAPGQASGSRPVREDFVWEDVEFGSPPAAGGGPRREPTPLTPADLPEEPPPERRRARQLLAAVVPGPRAKVALAVAGTLLLLGVLVAYSSGGALAERFWYLRFRDAEPAPPPAAAVPEPPRAAAVGKALPKRAAAPAAPLVSAGRSRTAAAVRATPASAPPAAPAAPAAADDRPAVVADGSLFQLAADYREVGDLAAAERTYRRLMDEGEHAARAAQELGDLCFAAGRFDEAAAHYRAAARLFKSADAARSRP